VAFGTSILEKDFLKGDNEDEDIPPVFLLRNILEISDAISILVGNSSIDACKPLVRCLQEASFGLTYMLTKDSLQKGMSYIVCAAHKDLKFINKYGSNEIQNLGTPSGSQKASSEILEHNRQALIEMLKLPKYVEIEQEYQRTKTQRKIATPEWYSLFDGPRNFLRLASDLNKSEHYEILYRNYSNSVHSTGVYKEKMKFVSPGVIDMMQIRYPKDAQNITSHTMNYILDAFSVHVRNRMPEMRPELKEWYSTIKEEYLSLFSKEYFTVK
jgi:hypothetical protein